MIVIDVFYCISLSKIDSDWPYFILFLCVALMKDEGKTARVTTNVKPVISVYNAAGTLLRQLRVSGIRTLRRLLVNKISKIKTFTTT